MDLRQVMKRTGVSNEGMATLTGMPSGRIASYKSGGRVMGAKSANRIADAIDADSAELVVGNRRAALERAMKRGDRRGVYKSMRTILATAEKSTGGVSDEAVDGLLNTAVKFLEETPAGAAGAAGGWGLGDDYTDADGRNARGERVIPFEDLKDGEDEDDVDDEGRDARGIRRGPAKETR